jgi:hypothetical protein
MTQINYDKINLGVTPKFSTEFVMPFLGELRHRGNHGMTSDGAYYVRTDNGDGFPLLWEEDGAWIVEFRATADHAHSVDDFMTGKVMTGSLPFDADAFDWDEFHKCLDHAHEESAYASVSWAEATEAAWFVQSDRERIVAHLRGERNLYGEIVQPALYLHVDGSVSLMSELSYEETCDSMWIGNLVRLDEWFIEVEDRSNDDKVNAELTGWLREVSREVREAGL